MLFVEQRLKFSIDFHQFERLLSHVSQFVNISIEINSLEGKTLVCTHGHSNGVGCNKQGAEPVRCHAESFNISRQIEKSGKTVVQKCYENIDIIGIPLKCNKDIVGILFACASTDNGNMSNKAIEFLEEIANRISNEILNQFEINDVTQELSDKYEELNLIYDIWENIGKLSNAEEAVKLIVEQSNEILTSRIVLVSIPSKHILELSYNDLDPLPIDINDKSLLEKIGRVIIDRLNSAYISPSHIVINNCCNDMQLANLFGIPFGILAVPVQLKGHVSGFMCIINFHPKKSFLTGDVKLATSLARQISMALTKLELYQNLKDFSWSMS